METNYRGAGLKVLNEQAVAECRVYPANLETRLGLYATDKKSGVLTTPFEELQSARQPRHDGRE
jgi:hypothetical protein